jgi:hypothetical protein
VYVLLSWLVLGVVGIINNLFMLLAKLLGLFFGVLLGYVITFVCYLVGFTAALLIASKFNRKLRPAVAMPVLLLCFGVLVHYDEDKKNDKGTIICFVLGAAWNIMSHRYKAQKDEEARLSRERRQRDDDLQRANSEALAILRAEQRAEASARREQEQKDRLPPTGPTAKLTRTESHNLRSVSGEVFYAGSECPICFEEYTENQVLRTLPCKHAFHKECIANWLAQPHSGQRCSVCREKATTYGRLVEILFD